MKYLRAIAAFAVATATAAGAAQDTFESMTRQVMETGDREALEAQEARHLIEDNSQKLSVEEYLAGCGDGNDLSTLDLHKAGQPLREPVQITADSDGVVRAVFYYDVINYIGPVFNTILRLYNGNAPGPTVRVKPGQTMEFTLVNCLHLPAGYGGSAEDKYGAHNRFKTPNITNLHTHGPHFNGMDPGDNILVEVHPRTVHHYQYVFGPNHMPGSFWYHPHSHGSTATQTAQGASGLIIVDYPNAYPLPSNIKDMPEVQMVMHHMDLPLLVDSSSINGDLVTNWVDENFEITNATSTVKNLMLVNMQFLPRVEMEVGKWYRWRIVHTSVQASLAFESESGNCEFHLLAKDGIFLNDAPREVPVIITSPAQRADVAVRCNTLGEEKMNSTAISMYEQENFAPGDFNYSSTRSSPARLDPNIPDMVGTFQDPEHQPVIFLVDVVGTSDPPDAPLETLNAPRPCYLVDLTDVPAVEIAAPIHQNRYNCDHVNCTNPAHHDLCDDEGHKYETGASICWPMGPFGEGGNASFPMPFLDGDTYINEFEVGTVREIELQMANYHPYHQHINPYQIVSINGAWYDEDGKETGAFPADPNNNPLEGFVNTWYQIGDWHDTLQMPTAQASVSWNVRFQIDQFTGKMVQHCHLLFHEDRGMMSQYRLYGNEGDVWKGAYAIDATCVRAGESYGSYGSPKPRCNNASDCVGVKKCKNPNQCECNDGKCRKKFKDCSARPKYGDDWGCVDGKECIVNVNAAGKSYKWGKCRNP